MSSVLYRWLGVIALLLVALPVRAQEIERSWLVEGSAAYVFVVGDYADVAQDGWAASGLLGYRVASQLWLLGDFSYYSHDGEGELPAWKNYGYFGMLGFDVLEPGFNGAVIVYVGAGGVTYGLDVEGQGRSTELGLKGGLKIVYDLSRNVSGALTAAAAVAFADEEMLGGDTWFFPLGIGLALRF